MFAGADEECADALLECAQPVRQFRWRYDGANFPLLGPTGGKMPAGAGFALAPVFHRLLTDQTTRGFSALSEIHARDDVRTDHADPGIGLVMPVRVADLGKVLCAEHHADALGPANIQQG